MIINLKVKLILLFSLNYRYNKVRKDFLPRSASPPQIHIALLFEVNHITGCFQRVLWSWKIVAISECWPDIITLRIKVRRAL